MTTLPETRCLHLRYIYRQINIRHCSFEEHLPRVSDLAGAVFVGPVAARWNIRAITGQR